MKFYRVMRNLALLLLVITVVIVGFTKLAIDDHDAAIVAFREAETECLMGPLIPEDPLCERAESVQVERTALNAADERAGTWVAMSAIALLLLCAAASGWGIAFVLSRRN